MSRFELPEPDRVSLGGFEIPRALLDPRSPGIELQDAAAWDALRAAIGRESRLETVPPSGWRPVHQDEQSLTFGAYDTEHWDGWVLITLAAKSGGWQYDHGSYGAQPRPTRRQKGFGLRLVWPQEQFEAVQGEHPQLSILLVNERSDPWVDEDGEYWAIATLRDVETKQIVAPGEVFMAGVGRRYELAPGESIELGVVLAAEKAETLPIGRYDVRAEVPELAVESNTCLLQVVQRF